MGASIVLHSARASLGLDGLAAMEDEYLAMGSLDDHTSTTGGRSLTGRQLYLRELISQSSLQWASQGGQDSLQDLQRRCVADHGKLWSATIPNAVIG